MAAGLRDGVELLGGARAVGVGVARARPAVLRARPLLRPHGSRIHQKSASHWVKDNARLNGIISVIKLIISDRVTNHSFVL